MKLLEVKCPNCGAAVETTEEMVSLVENIAIVGSQTIECNYCGSKLMTPGAEVQLVDRVGKSAVIIGSITGGVHGSIISSGDVKVELKEEQKKWWQFWHK